MEWNKPIWNIRIIFKGMLAAMVLSTYFIITIPISFLIPLSPFKIRKFLNRIVAIFCAIMSWVLGVRYTINGDLSVLKEDNFLIIANHLSYLDIFNCYSLFPSCFVTSMEMKETPLLGQVTLAAGCLYVERRSRENIHKEIENVVDGLKNGLNVFVFPEATSTNGEGVKMFRKSMFNTAIDSGKKILPITLNYTSIDGVAVSKENRDKIFWYGEMSFYPHILHVLNHKRIELEFKIHQPVSDIQKFESDIALANHCHQIIDQSYNKIS